MSDLSDKFYTLIPHNFGFAKMCNFIIDTKEKLQAKLDLISNLIDINVAFNNDKKSKRATAKKGTSALEPNPVDTKYEALDCKIEAVESNQAEYKMIESYFNVNKKSNINMQQVYKVGRNPEQKGFNPLNLDNKKLLWHGTRFSNFVGILTNGMRIAPPEAPCSGSLFGKGLYFADMAEKSTNYCRTYDSKGIGLMLLCEVALGNPQQALRPTHSSTLATGCNSTHAVGTTRPEASGSIMFEKNIEIPMGKPEYFSGGGMPVNEWIVYNTNQVRIRYIVKFKQN